MLRVCIACVSLPALVALAGCAGDGPTLPKFGDLNPFAEKAVPLPGKRIPVMQTQEVVTGELADASAPITLPPARANQDWAQPGGEANNAPGHLAFSGAANEAWSADAGAGSGSEGRVTASPIVYADRVYTLDAEASVAAFASSGGSSLWRISLKPERENASGSWFSLGGGGTGGGYGGGLAVDSGRIYAATGYGNVVALDPQTGKKMWEKQLGGAGALLADSGRRQGVHRHARWAVLLSRRRRRRGAVVGARSAAAGEPHQQREPGRRRADRRRALSVGRPHGAQRRRRLLGVVGEPVAHAHDLAADLHERRGAPGDRPGHGVRHRPCRAHGCDAAATGERVWSLNVPGTQPPWVAGGSVFVVDTGGQLMAISRQDGKTQWTMKLPDFNTWSGPTLAGGTLWLASAKGALVGVDAATGRVTTQKDIGSPVYIAPVVAQGRMYILTDKAKLIALN